MEAYTIQPDGDLELIGAEGTATTVLPAELFIKSSLETVSLAGFTEIGESAFKDTKYLESVTIPNVTVIGAGAFANTARLESIELPAVTEIGASAFAKSSEIRESNNAKCCDDRSVSIRTYIGRGCNTPCYDHKYWIQGICW